MGTNVRRVGLAVAAVTALAGVAACSSSGSSGGSGKDEGASASGGGTTRVSPLAALRSAEKSTDAADSARVESTTTMGSLMSMKADGAMGWSDGITGTLTITYTGGQMADAMRQLGTTSMEARYLSDAYYARMGEKFARQTGGKHWIRYGYDDLARLGGGSGAYLKDQMRHTTPNQSVKLLLASGDVQKVGEEKVRGQDTTHYAGTLDVADLAKRNSGLSAGQLADLKKQLTQAGVTTETVDIWVDDHDLLVKKIEKGEMSAGSYTQTAYYSDYGVKVLAAQPPAGDTEDFTKLVGQQGGAGTTS
ncbi:LolA-like protein [Streptomyces sp. 7R007]